MPGLDNLIRVARALAPIRERRFVFAGAGILPLLINDPAAPPPRFTVDVDAVVDLLSYGQWHQLQERLCECGLVVRADQPGRSRHCLFHLESLEVDIMPVKVPELGCPSRMLELGFEFAQPHQLAGDLDIFTLSAPGLMAAKLEAFAERGRKDVLMSKDLEDIITLFDCRIGMEQEIVEAPAEIRAFIVTGLSQLLCDGRVLDVISDTIRDRVREQRLRDIMRRLSLGEP